jgi:hypothetical protein
VGADRRQSPSLASYRGKRPGANNVWVSCTKITVPFIQSYAGRFANLPEAERVQAEKMLAQSLSG